MNLPNTPLTGTIPSLLGALPLFATLYMYNNQFAGTSSIPTTLGNVVQLYDLSLSDNQLNGTMPSTL